MEYQVLGLMSGTSLDGVDLVHCQFQTSAKGWTYTILNAKTYSYPSEWLSKLAFRSGLPATELLQLNHQYGLFLARVCTAFIDDFAINRKNIHLLASHGHTLFHQPDKGYTLQIGNGPELFSELQIPVVCDFRPQDVALGGQGAPLVPIGDQLLFHPYDACLNLGGFANISFEEKGVRRAFDICPVNFILNPQAQKLGKPYDDEGEMARQGKVDQPLLDKLEQLPFYQQAPPKSLGAEWVNYEFMPLVKPFNLKPPALLSTFTQHIAQRIGEVLKNHTFERTLVSGGGAYNRFLLERVQQISGCKLIIPEPEVIDFKEALVFALMGLLKHLGKNNILASVTGARHNHSSGVIYQ